MRFVCVFEAVYVCVCAGQSKTGSIVKAFETLLSYHSQVFRVPGFRLAELRSEFWGAGDGVESLGRIIFRVC
jgi:hypothetical protein